MTKIFQEVKNLTNSKARANYFVMEFQSRAICIEYLTFLLLEITDYLNFLFCELHQLQCTAILSFLIDLSKF